MKSKLIVYVALASLLILAFISGQLFYYNQKPISTEKPAPVTDRFSANLSSALSSGLVLKSSDWQKTVPPDEVKKWVESYTRSYTGKEALRLNVDNVIAYLQGIAPEINNPAENARFQLDEEGLSQIKPAQDGKILDFQTSALNIVAYLAQTSPNQLATIQLALNEVKAEINLDKVNTLGIKELLGRGESNFGGSPKYRTNNINVGAKKFTGIIVKPGEEFSFNKFLGSVDAASGYLPELVIKNGKLIPEYGGGLCQVSTTLFRAIMAAGLPITERHAHSLPVHYYNPQGYDASIYPGVSDFKFKNDTPNYILIQSKVSGSKIYFDVYGTKDGRQVAIDGPHQYDIKPNGAMKAVVTRVTTYADGQNKKDVFNSNYKSPSQFVTIRNPLE